MMTEKYMLSEDEYYEYDEADRHRLCLLGLKEDDLGRYRGTREEFHPVLNKNFIVIETRDGILSCDNDEWFWSQSMLNNVLFSHLSTYEDMSYLDYWFFMPNAEVTGRRPRFMACVLVE